MGLFTRLDKLRFTGAKCSTYICAIYRQKKMHCHRYLVAAADSGCLRVRDGKIIRAPAHKNWSARTLSKQLFNIFFAAAAFFFFYLRLDSLLQIYVEWWAFPLVMTRHLQNVLSFCDVVCKTHLFSCECWRAQGRVVFVIQTILLHFNQHSENTFLPLLRINLTKCGK